MTEMQFLPELKKYLIEHGIIYTVRKFNMSEGRVRVEGVGICHRKPLGEIVLQMELEGYVSQSGFASMKEWLAVIRRFVPVNVRMYLYEVSLVEEPR